MCGRFTLRGSGGEVARHFELSETPTLSPRYNAAPGQAIAVVREPEPGRRSLEWQRWGLVPAGLPPGAGLRPLVNARSETAARRRSFAGALRRRRCLVPADGFYEWGAPGGGPRRPYHVRLADAGLFAIAALWEPLGQSAGEAPAPATRHPTAGSRPRVSATCALLTTPANATLAPVHDRMPAILWREDYARWLDPRVDDPEMLRELLQPLPAEAIERVPVGPRVNRVAVDDPSCLEPPTPESQPALPF